MIYLEMYSDTLNGFCYFIHYSVAHLFTFFCTENGLVTSGLETTLLQAHPSMAILIIDYIKWRIIVT